MSTDYMIDLKTLEKKIHFGDEKDVIIVLIP